ncbi:MAG TPA: hypothetical protein VFX85_03875 [Solirubrobacterales bacterium]|nr:hypothetical protein [Solirubrobacterales bacterium]
MAVAALLAACGGDESSDANEQQGTYEVKVTGASFPTEQQLGQTSLLKLGVRNSGEKTVPTLTVTISIAGKQGENSSLPFAIDDPTEGVSQGDRPVWVLAATYPRFAGSQDPGGASTSNNKTFAFGPLKPGKTANVVWKLSAVKAGDYTVLYRVGAGLGEGIKTKTTGGVAPGGSFKTEISNLPPDTEVTDNGEVVEKSVQRQRSQPGE